MTWQLKNLTGLKEKSIGTVGFQDCQLQKGTLPVQPELNFGTLFSLARRKI